MEHINNRLSSVLFIYFVKLFVIIEVSKMKGGIDMSLFWYPDLELPNIFDGDFDKPKMLNSYIRYYLARLQSMFKYDGLPETIPAKWLENILLTKGNAAIIKVNDKLVAVRAGVGGSPNAYYVPAEVIVNNPYLPNEVNHSYIHDDNLLFIRDGLTTTDTDCVLILNDTYSQGLIPMLVKYCSQLVENDISMYLADIQARAILNISAADDSVRASGELYLKRLREGKLGVMANNAFLKDLDIKVFKEAAQILTDLIEYHQYIKASLFNELGLNSNYNMKRESINSNESQLNDDMLHPLIDNMLAERKEGVEKINALFGTNISVEFAGAWLSNEIEEQAIINTMINNSDVELNDELTDELNTEDVDTDDNEDVVEDDVIQNEPLVVESDVIEDNIESDDTKVVESLEDLKEDVSDIKEVVEEINNELNTEEGGDTNE